MRQQIEARPHVVRHADVLHHLVNLEKIHQGERVLLRVDPARLERVVNPVAVDRDRFGSQRSERVGDHLSGRHPHPDADQIVRTLDRTLRPGDVPHPVVERPGGKSEDAFGRHLLPQKAAKRPVHRLVGMGGRAERERHLLDFGSRHDGAENAAHQREELNLAGDQHVERCRIASSEPVVLSEDLRLDASPRLGPDRRPHFNEAPVQRARRRLVMELGERVVGPPPLALLVRATSRRAEAFGEGGRPERLDENRYRPDGGAGDKCPARERSRHPIFLQHADLNRHEHAL